MKRILMAIAVPTAIVSGSICFAYAIQGAVNTLGAKWAGVGLFSLIWILFCSLTYVLMGDD